MDRINEILSHIDPISLSYQEWINVGMALHHEGYEYSIWDEWSKRDPQRYKDGDCFKKWKSFGHSFNTDVTIGTLVQMAKDRGYVPPSNRLLEWDDYIESDDNVVVSDVNNLASEYFEPIAVSHDEYDGISDFKRYIEVLFDEDDYVSFNIKSWKDDDGKYKPSGNGNQRKAKDLLKALSKTSDITDVIGTYDENAGAWIRFNPMDGVGIRNDNVKKYKYALVESDNLELDQQIAIIKEMQLPVAVMLYSGGKSVHAIVKIDAADKDEYRERVEYLYQACKNNHLTVDTQNKNPSRLSRLPGVKRNDKYQHIIDTNIGKSSWIEWKDWIDGISDDFPDFDSFYDIYKNGIPELAPELIEGILRQGHKFRLTGPSKAGKSFALIQLCIAIASGTEWMGHKCKKGKVLYLNFELDRISCFHRFSDVYDALGITPDKDNEVVIWNLRGRTVPLDQLGKKLIRRAANQKFSAIVMDPIYKIITGDENSASEMAKFCNYMDTIATELKVAIIDCHHHSKGAQGHKNSMDRSSGSGVFARDPDAIVDMIQIDPSDCGKSLEEGQSAWRLSYTLREFRTPNPREVIFDYPVHRITHELSDAGEMYGADKSTNGTRGNKKKKEQKSERIERLETFVENFMEENRRNPTLEDAETYFQGVKGFSSVNIKKWCQSADTELHIIKNRICTSDQDKPLGF